MAALIRLALGFAYGGGSVESEMVLLADEDVMEVIASHINSLIIAFTRAGAHVDISQGAIAQKTSWGSFAGRSAICDYPMVSGRHYVLHLLSTTNLPRAIFCLYIFELGVDTSEPFICP